MKSLVDKYGRVVRDLRISVTPRCNFKCVYCEPLSDTHSDPIGTVSVTDVDNVIKAGASLGMNAVRFTGGEPLLRKELPEMIRNAKNTEGIDDIAITTNATLLKRRLPELLDAGLDRLNISIDAVDSDVFSELTRGGKIDQVWDGIAAAQEAGLGPIKLNAVIMNGQNDHQLTKLAALTKDQDIHMRYIEYMHLNNSEEESYFSSFLSGKQVKEMIENEFGPLEVVNNDPSAPARLFKVPGWKGAIGFINPVTEPFCGACSRMRLTSDAKLRPCLMTDREIDIREAINHATPIEAIQEMLLVAAHRKVESGIVTPVQRPRTMMTIGG